MIVLDCIEGGTITPATPTTDWKKLQDGVVKIKFPKDVIGWNITFTFNKPVNYFMVFDAAESKCPEVGTTCHCVSTTNNNVQKKGSVFTSKYEIKFVSTDQPPQVTSVIITTEDGTMLNLCGLDGKAGK